MRTLMVLNVMNRISHFPPLALSEILFNKCRTLKVQNSAHRGEIGTLRVWHLLNRISHFPPLALSEILFNKCLTLKVQN